MATKAPASKETINNSPSFLQSIIKEASVKDVEGEYITFGLQADITPNYLSPKFFFRTGLYLPDRMLGHQGNAGFGSGRMTELYGQNRTGKSALATQMANRALLDHPGVHVLYVDMERALTTSRLEPYPMFRTSRFNVVCPSTLDKAFAIVIKALKQALEEGLSLFIVFDSVAAMKTNTEMSAADGKIVMMAQAAMFSKELPRVRGLLSKTNSFLLMLNQMRDKNQTGGKPGAPPPDHTPGGHAIKFYADYRVKTASFGKYSLSTGAVAVAGVAPSGFMSRISVVKNKIGIPDRSVIVPLIFFPNQGRPSGLSELWSIFDALKKEKLLKSAGGKYHFAGDKANSFKRVEWRTFMEEHSTVDPVTLYPTYTGVLGEALEEWERRLHDDSYGSNPDAKSDNEEPDEEGNGEEGGEEEEEDSGS